LGKNVNWAVVLMLVIRLILEGMEAAEAAEKVAKNSAGLISADRIISFLPDRYL
jgi:hypothetical protein